ncbi:MAG: hypothetical protein M3Y27_03530 [Acidobacteriota bacterium]|nr:hypothetical protein [Acidobacteriota bacterium]
MNRRADFSAATRKIIAERAGYQCSVLNCGRLTVGPGSGKNQVMNVGMAAHIYAASPGGPRGTGGLSAVERSEPENGIWCCYSHGKAIDSNNGNTISAAQLKAWKRLHEARKNAEIAGAPQDRFGLVESISVNSAPASLTGRKFELGMRNIITGPNGSGKTVLTKLIASVAYPDHVAKLSRSRDVDIEVRWFDPHTHDVATTGRSGNVTHVLDGRAVPYVARPYKTILLDDRLPFNCLGSITSLSQMFDLSASAMKGTLSMLPASSAVVRGVDIRNTHINWVIELNGHAIQSAAQAMSGSTQMLILSELIGIHARHHALVEPTFLIVDGLIGFHHTAGQIAFLERLQTIAEHAQIAVVSPNPSMTSDLSSEWQRTALEVRPASNTNGIESPIDFEIETTTTPPSSLRPAMKMPPAGSPTPG